MKRSLTILFFLSLFLQTAGQTADFTYTAGNQLYCAPAQVQFTSSVSGTPKGYLWDFGNGTRSNKVNPVVTFTQAGTYQVRLIAVYDDTTAEKTRTISIERAVSTSFTANREEMCSPGPVSFTSTSSSNAQRYEWDFGDDSPVLNTTATNVSHTYTGLGSFVVTLKAISATGCFGSASGNIQIRKPEITGTFTTLNTSGCAPMNIRYAANVRLPAGSTVTQYSWHFGDGNSLNTSTRQTTYTYRNAGVYGAYVSIRTSDGCTNEFHFDSVYVGTPPTNHRAYVVDSVICGSDKAVFISTATGANSYDWDFGNGNIVTTQDSILEKKFSSLGIHTVTVTPKYYQCKGNPITLQVEVVGVIAKYAFRNSCADRRTFDFNNNSLGNVTSYLWEVGNQRTPVYTYDMTRTFPPLGSFPVVLTIADSVTGCVDSLPRRVYTANPRLRNPDEEICIRSVTTYQVERTYPSPDVLYTWNVLGDTASGISSAERTLQANQHGIFNVNTVVVMMGSAYCPDTLMLDHPVTVRGPLLQTDMPDNICLNQSLNIVNRSTAYFPSDSIISWTWDMGDNTNREQSYQPAPHTYIEDRMYTVTLMAGDINGCRDTLRRPVGIRPLPFLWTIPRGGDLCRGQEKSFVAYTSDPLQWEPVGSLPGLCMNCDSIQVNPSQSVLLKVSATNAYQCASFDSIYLRVVQPFTALLPFGDTAICQGQNITLDAEPKNKMISWEPAAQCSNPNIYNPVISPKSSTIFKAILTDSTGCFTSTAQVAVTVKSNPTVQLGQDLQLPYFSNFTLQPRYSDNVRRYLWSPGDSLSCDRCPNPSGQAITSKKYTVTAISDSGCIARDDIYVFVACNGASLLMPKAFTPNNDRLNDTYYPITRGIQFIKRFSVYNRYGQLLFESRNFIPNKQQFGWNGNFQGQPQPSAGYVFIVEGTCDTGQMVELKGSFILIR